MKEIKITILCWLIRSDTTKTELAEHIGITRVTLNKYLDHPTDWNLGKLHLAYDFLGVPQDQRVF